MTRPRPLPHFKRRGGAIFQLSAGRAHGISVQPALDGVAGFNVIGMIQLVQAIVVHTTKRSARHQVTPMLRKRDAAQAMYPPGRATRGKKMCCAYWNLVAALFGANSALSRSVYVLVGLSAAWLTVSLLLWPREWRTALGDA